MLKCPFYQECVAFAVVGDMRQTYLITHISGGSAAIDLVRSPNIEYSSSIKKNNTTNEFIMPCTHNKRKYEARTTKFACSAGARSRHGQIDAGMSVPVVL